MKCFSVGTRNAKQDIWLEALTYLSKGRDIVALETGRSRSPDWVDTDGDSTGFLSSLDCIGTLISVDDDSEDFSGYETTREYCNQALSEARLEKIVFLDGDSVEMISTQLGGQAILDFVLLDSSNNPDVIFREFLAVERFLNKQQSVVVIDDVSPPGQKGNRLIPHLVGLGFKEHRREAPPGDCSFFVLENIEEKRGP